ncbi:centrosome-associated protein CEP250-like [Corvus moneduloides]|uniref:centrosome-associated protein CEP250-like n=1 Tax=Corvus moneduloides TaxID=1196302 RepID=UPI0013631081|nr:centrosome-associated protein CEP250-like [Corvus moneduloides]
MSPGLCSKSLPGKLGPPQGRQWPRGAAAECSESVLLEKQKVNSLSETLLQTRGQLSLACQQVQQLRQEVKEQQEKGQTIEAKLQAELQEARREIQAAQKRHKEELRGIKEEMNLLLEQREALQKQVGELTSQLAASRESQATIVQRAQQDVSWAQEQSRQKLLEVEHLQKMLEEAEHQNKELQVHLKNLELEGSHWEEVARQNSGFRASLDALEKEKARLILSLEEKNLCLRTLEEKNQALNNQVCHLHSVLQESEQLCSELRRQLLELNTQIQAELEAVIEKAALQPAQEKQELETEVSELRVRLQSSEERAEAMATQCKALELELREVQAQRDHLKARNQELQQELEESEQAMWRAEHQKTSRETALEKEAIALKEEAVTLHQEVAPLQRKLESLEKERKDVLRERELYEEQMGDLKKKNEMNTPEMQTHKENPQQLEVDREAKQEQLEHGAAALKEWQETAQVLCAALSKSEISKGALKKDLDILKERIRLQVGTGIDLQSTSTSLSDSNEVSHEEAVGAEGKRLSERSRKGVECVRDQVAAAAKDKPEKRELRRTFEVSQEQESSSRALEQLHQESSGQGHALAQVCREKELLGQEKAALEGRLAAMECHKQDLSKQLAETRSAKESLESSLFAAQQQISQLEITSSHLEAQVLTVTQAKEALQGEVQCLQRELEAERALRKQEQEDTAQQLLQAEQQCQESLRLQGTAQQVEINKLLQDLASERERHHAEMQETLQQWGKEKAEREQEHEKVLFEMRQKVATLQAQREEERTRFENAKREVLLEKQKVNSLSETLLQTRGQLSRACQQVQQLRQEVKEQQEKGQTIEAKLQAELQEARREIQAAQKRHEEELRGIKEEMNVLLEQREALQKQVGELTSQLAASRESQATIVQRAQQDVSWAQEQSRQKLLEVEHLQKMLEEAEHQNKELQVHLKNLELEGSHWEEVARQNSGFWASLDALEKEKARLILSLEEKNLCLRTLEEKNQALNNQVCHLHSVLQESEQLCSELRRQLLELNTQIQAELEAVIEKAALQPAQEKQELETEVSELRVRLQSSEERAEAMATQCKALELELREVQAQRDHLKARNQELQQELEESEQAMWRAEHQKTSRETALEKEAIALKEEAVTLHQEVAPLQRKLESLEKERKDVLRERELYEEQMGDLKKKNEMNTPEMQTHKENPQQLEVDREAKQEQLEHGAAALKEWQETAQVLCAALSKSEISKGALKKDLDILKERLRLQQAVGAEGKRLSERSRKGVECVRDQVAAAAKDKPEKRELRRTFEVSLLQSQLARDRQDNLESCAGSRQEMLPLSHKDLLTS